ncbi:MAG: class I SAM-dependent methyltransferase, partial [Candidatus Dormibacteraceae bacterium]
MHNDVERFSEWAPAYDRHHLQRRVFEPVQRMVLDLAAVEVPQPQAILDIGCGTGRLLRTCEQRFASARLEGVDAAEGMIEQARSSASGSSIGFQLGTAEHLPFGDAEFDIVFSTMTFHHWA